MNERDLVIRARGLMVGNVDFESLDEFVEDIGGRDALLKFIRRHGEDFYPLFEAYDDGNVRRGYD